ncbi:unnamed protein product, partial [Rotaria magnacalcarata]
MNDSKNANGPVHLRQVFQIEITDVLNEAGIA